MWPGNETTRGDLQELPGNLALLLALLPTQQAFHSPKLPGPVHRFRRP